MTINALTSNVGFTGQHTRHHPKSSVPGQEADPRSLRALGRFREHPWQREEWAEQHAGLLDY